MPQRVSLAGTQIKQAQLNTTDWGRQGSILNHKNTVFMHHEVLGLHFHGLSGGVMVAQGPLEALVKVRILAGQPFLSAPAVEKEFSNVHLPVICRLVFVAPSMEASYPLDDTRSFSDFPLSFSCHGDSRHAAQDPLPPISALAVATSCLPWGGSGQELRALDSRCFLEWRDWLRAGGSALYVFTHWIRLTLLIVHCVAAPLRRW